jgi:hypothetical protein
MNSRERVLCATNQRDPDRIPIFAPKQIATHESLDPRVQRPLAPFPFYRTVIPHEHLSTPYNLAFEGRQ